MPWAKILLQPSQKYFNLGFGETIDPLNDAAGSLHIARAKEPGNRPLRIGLQL
jgi:hypothetical protein